MDTWPSWLENELRSEGLSVNVWNAGRAGSTLRDHLKYLKDRGLDIKPDLVILQYTPNDIPDYRACLPPNRQRRTVESLRPTTIVNNTALILLWVRLTTPIDSATGETTVQSATRGDDLCSYTTPDFWYGDQREALNPLIEMYRQDLTEATSYLDTNNVPLLFVMIPDHVLIHNNYENEQGKLLEEMIDDIGYGHFFDLTPLFEEIDDIEALYLLAKSNEIDDQPFVGNGHPSRYGYSTVGRGIAPVAMEMIREAD